MASQDTKNNNTKAPPTPDTTPVTVVSVKLPEFYQANPAS